MNRPVMKRILPWLIAAAFLLLRITCRLRFHRDPRVALRAAGRNYVFATLHAHQLAGLLAAEPGLAGIVSRSDDGDIVVPTLRLAGCVPIRGSGGKARKGGTRAMQQLIRHVRGGRPASLTVDGPLGPRGRVHPGVALLSQKTGAEVLTVVAVPSRRTVLSRTWDRLQLPWPFARVDIRFGPTLSPRPAESVADFARRIERGLSALEHRWDPQEAVAGSAGERSTGSAAAAA